MQSSRALNTPKTSRKRNHVPHRPVRHCKTTVVLLAAERTLAEPCADRRQLRGVDLKPGAMVRTGECSDGCRRCTVKLGLQRWIRAAWSAHGCWIQGEPQHNAAAARPERQARDFSMRFTKADHWQFEHGCRDDRCSEATVASRSTRRGCGAAETKQ